MQMYTGVARVVRAVSSRVVKTASRIVQIFDHSCGTIFFFVFRRERTSVCKKKKASSGAWALDAVHVKCKPVVNCRFGR